eukprot:TRINITY_DN1526_c0_g1_i1.p1 TRINITY_DN1526_c0_g1~~TRINITY_DN1526_c0_g1_i1.p1  ORF type:complete len:235 (-),score=58.55 TRINITY_DN1526_c0_g1_i1:55-759(-)
MNTQHLVNQQVQESTNLEKNKDSIFSQGPTDTANSHTHFIRTLERDHDEFRRLYQEYRSSLTLRERKAILNELIRGISIHDVIETRYLYPALEKYVPSEGKISANKARNDHEEARKLLKKIDQLADDNPSLPPLVDTLMTELETHMREEETNLFVKLQMALSPEDAVKLGKDLDSARSSAPTHPHPNAPNNPIALAAVGLATAPFDKLKDLGKEFTGGSKETTQNPSTINNSGL